MKEQSLGPRSQPTIRDVASLARVSVATVSRAINQPTRLSAHTLLKVRAAIASLSFTPNQHAQNLARGPLPPTFIL
jgi:LacI family transcriptional regulator